MWPTATLGLDWNTGFQLSLQDLPNPFRHKLNKQRILSNRSVIPKKTDLNQTNRSSNFTPSLRSQTYMSDRSISVTDICVPAATSLMYFLEAFGRSLVWNPSVGFSHLPSLEIKADIVSGVIFNYLFLIITILIKSLNPRFNEQQLYSFSSPLGFHFFTIRNLYPAYTSSIMLIIVF